MMFNLTEIIEHLTCDFVLTFTFALKVKLSLCLTKHHAVKTYWEVEV
jgi:hypothetical protein